MKQSCTIAVGTHCLVFIISLWTLPLTITCLSEKYKRVWIVRRFVHFASISPCFAVAKISRWCVTRILDNPKIRLFWPKNTIPKNFTSWLGILHKENGMWTCMVLFEKGDQKIFLWTRNKKYWASGLKLQTKPGRKIYVPEWHTVTVVTLQHVVAFHLLTVFQMCSTWTVQQITINVQLMNTKLLNQKAASAPRRALNSILCCALSCQSFRLVYFILCTVWKQNSLPWCG